MKSLLAFVLIIATTSTTFASTFESTVHQKVDGKYFIKVTQYGEKVNFREVSFQYCEVDRPDLCEQLGAHEKYPAILFRVSTIFQKVVNSVGGIAAGFSAPIVFFSAIFGAISIPALIVMGVGTGLIVVGQKASRPQNLVKSTKRMNAKEKEMAVNNIEKFRERVEKILDQYDFHISGCTYNDTTGYLCLSNYLF